MVDFMAGEWRGNPSSISGLKEYLEALGMGETYGFFHRSFTIVYKLEGSNRLGYESSFEGIEGTIKGIYDFGEKTENAEEYFVGPGFIKSTYTKEGNTVVSIANYNGLPLVRTTYVQGNTMTMDYTFGNVKASFKMYKV